jgi:integrase/recombinase XerD
LKAFLRALFLLPQKRLVNHFNHQPQTTSIMKLSQAIEGFLLEKRINLSQATTTKYAYVFRRFIDFIGDKDMKKVTSNDVRRFLEHLRTQHEQGDKTQLSQRTIHDYYAPLSSLWSWAEQELGIPHIIKGKVKAPEFNKTVIEPFTKDEVQRLARAAEFAEEWSTRRGRNIQSKRPTADRDKAILLTLVDAGLRASELCALTLADYDAARGRLHVRHGKGDKERYVVIGARTQKAIWKYLTGRPKPKTGDPLFATRENRHIDRENLHHMLSRMGDRAGVENVFPHRFRHTFAIEFLRNGGNVILLKELLGHESLEMVMTYVRIAERDIEGSARHSPADNWRI